MDYGTRMIENRIIEKYERKVIRAKVGCWGWNGAVDSNGYGVIGVWYPHLKKTKNIRAHVVSYRMGHALKPGQQVLHKCHNPTCSNPEHLVAGTCKQNMAMSQRDGRLQRKIPLTDLPALAVRRKAGETWKQLAVGYGCTLQAIRHMVTRHA